MNRDLQASLLKDNPWLVSPGQLETWLRLRLPETYIPRLDAFRTGQRWDEPNRAHLVIGPRQAGKSTALWTHLAERGKPVLYIDCEQQLVREWCRSAPLFLADLEKVSSEPVPLFFEEVQHLDEAGLFFKGLVDRKIQGPILVTGSSSYHLGASTRESLAGRATRTRLLPFSFTEVCADLTGRPELIRNHLSDERLARHVAYGGYPEVWLSEAPEQVLHDLVEAIILRDASDLFRIARPDAFRRLLKLAAAQSGNLINLSEWGSIAGISRDTVASYLEILESSHVVVPLPPFAGGRRSEITGTPKIFLVDNGIRNHLLYDFKALEERADAGATLENWVFSELWKALPRDATLHFWRSTSGAEVDFVVQRGGQIVGIEVKVGHLRRPTLPRSARSFLDAYRSGKFLMVNGGLRHREKVGETDVQWLMPGEVVSKVTRAFAAFPEDPLQVY